MKKLLNEWREYIIYEELLKEAVDRYQNSEGKIFKLIPRKIGGMKVYCGQGQCSFRPLDANEWATEMALATPPVGKCNPDSPPDGYQCYKNIGPEPE